MAVDVSIVIPAFNERHRLPSTLERLVVELPLVCPGAWEVVVSDDGSTDGTAELARGWSSRWPVHVVDSEVHRGKGAALRAGMDIARHRLVVLLDADLPVPVTTIATLIGRSPTADLVLGSRRLPGASFDPPQPLLRRVGGSCFRAAVSWLGYDLTSDPQCGVKLLRAEVVLPLMRQITSAGFAFDVELIERARRSGLRVVEQPVAWRHVEGSSLRPVRDAVRTLAELRRLRHQLPAATPTVTGLVP